jgi:hypothetical protein
VPSPPPPEDTGVDSDASEEQDDRFELFSKPAAAPRSPARPAPAAAQPSDTAAPAVARSRVSRFR